MTCHHSRVANSELHLRSAFHAGQAGPKTLEPEYEVGPGQIGLTTPAFGAGAVARTSWLQSCAKPIFPAISTSHTLCTFDLHMGSLSVGGYTNAKVRDGPVALGKDLRSHVLEM